MDNKLKISNLDDAIEKMIKILDGDIDIVGKEVEIDDSLLHLTIKLDGEFEDFTITPNLMQSFLRIQDTIYEIYSLSKYGEKRRLSAEEKQALQFKVRISKGSLLYDIAMDFLTSVMGNMTGTETLIGIGIVAAAALAGFLGSRGMKLKEERIKSEERKESEKTQADAHVRQSEIAKEMVASVVEGMSGAARKILKEPASSLEVNGEKVEFETVSELVSVPRKRRPTEQIVYTGEFKITDIHIDEDEGTFIDAEHKGSGRHIKNINILADFISQDNVTVNLSLHD
jgi:hypothetical protein